MQPGTRYSIEVNPRIPKRLARLSELANNLWYSWDRPTRALFAKLNPALWEAVEWDWYRMSPDSDFLYWHWSPQWAFQIQHPLIGFNETVPTYLLGMASPTHPVPASLYYSGWASQAKNAQDYRQGWSGSPDGRMYANGNTFFGIKLDVGGFFDPRFRVHDFDAGRALAAAALAASPPLLADPADRPLYVPWSDRAPSLDAVPAARHRFVQRIGELTRQLLEYKIGFLGVTQAIAIVAQYVAPRLVRDSGPGRRPAIVRVEIEPTAGDADFFLAPHNGAAGGDARHVGGLVVLHTALHYSDTEIVGPHVVRTAAGWAVRLAARSKHPRARVLEIPLPDPAVLRANADCGLPIHRIRVDWATRTLGPWLQEDALQEWPGAYEV